MLSRVDGTQKTTSGKEAASEFSSIIGRRLPLTIACNIPRVHLALRDEFPHLDAQIGVVLNGLVQENPVRLPPTLLVGKPEGGKSRFARRLPKP